MASLEDSSCRRHRLTLGSLKADATFTSRIASSDPAGAQQQFAVGMTISTVTDVRDNTGHGPRIEASNASRSFPHGTNDNLTKLSRVHRRRAYGFRRDGLAVLRGQRSVGITDRQDEAVAARRVGDAPG